MKKLISIFFVALFLCNLVFAQDEPLVILEKPSPITLNASKLPHAQGAVRIRVEFLSSGTIGKISLVSGLSESIDKDAVVAAKKIKFKPAVKSGDPITIFKQIEYKFQYGWVADSQNDEKAEAIVKKAVEKLGGQNYLQVKTIVSSGNFTIINGGQQDYPRTFIDALVFPDKERTEFKQGGIKTIQTNSGANGWLYDSADQTLRAQTKNQIEDFQRSLRTSLDNLLRGNWRAEGGILSYAGRRQAGVGRRNDVLRVTYPDGFKVEFEFSDDGMPVKAVYNKTSANGGELKEEDRYAQFVEFQGVYVPLIVDHYINGNQTSRINYLKIELNKNIPDSIFTQPADAKSLKKDLKL